MNIAADFYDKKYYEDGIASGKSCYTNYRWIPELTIPMAYHFIKELDIKNCETILDVGCSKGYFVKALRLLGFEAYGTDISKYAIEHADTEIKDFCRLVTDDNPIPYVRSFDWIITKDVLEHMTNHHLDSFLVNYSDKAKKMFHVIPLGDNDKFRIPEYHLDKSHIQIHDEDWWKNLFASYGWRIKSLKYKTPGIKENWSEHHPTGNGFFTLIRD